MKMDSERDLSKLSESPADGEWEFKYELPEQKWLLATEFEPVRLETELAAMELPPTRICEFALPLKFHCWIQAFGDSQNYFVIPKSLQPLLDDFSQEMTKTYTSSTDIPALSINDMTSMGKMCAAEFDSEDGKLWYRARLEELSEDGRTATVLYVDFGNLEEKPLTELKPLLSVFARIPALALQCCETLSFVNADDFANAVEEADCDVHCELFSCVSPPYGARLSNPRVVYGTPLLGQRTSEFIHLTKELIQQLDARRLEDAELQEYLRLSNEDKASSEWYLEQGIKTAKNIARPSRLCLLRKMVEFARELKGDPHTNLPPSSVPQVLYQEANRIRKMKDSQRPWCITKYENKSWRAEPTIYNKIPLLVSHVKNTRDIYLLSPEGAEQAKTAEAVLTANYDNDSEAVKPEELVETRACVVRDQSMDGRWIRAVVDQVTPGVSVRLRAVDRGWTLPPIAWSRVADIKVLRTIDGIYDGPACWHLQLTEIDRAAPSFAETVILQLLQPEGQMVRVDFPSLKGRWLPGQGGWIGDIWDLTLEMNKEPLSKRVAAKLQELGYPLKSKFRPYSFAQQSSVATYVSLSAFQMRSVVAKGAMKQPETRIPDAEWSGRSGTLVIVSHYGCPWNIFVQTNEMKTEAQQLTRSMNQRYERELRLRCNNLQCLPPLEMGPGVFCVARFTDGLLYRAQILRIMEEEQRCEVQLVDYGNRAVVMIEKLLTLRPEFARMPRQCLGPCVLEGVPMPEHINEAVSNEVEAMGTELVRPLRRWWASNLMEEHVDGDKLFALSLLDPDEDVSANQIFQNYVETNCMS